MVATLYHIPRTISSPIVQILLELDLVDNPIHVEEISFRALKSKEHLALNPMGTSPTFHDSDLDITIWESGAVLTYLLERYDTEFQFHPRTLTHRSTAEETQNRAKYLHIKQYIIATVYPFIAAMYIHSLKPIAEQDQGYITAAKHKCKTIFCPLLSKWLGSGPYFLGEDISAVDFLAVKPLRNLHSMNLLENHFPSLYEFFERVTNRPTYVEAYNDELDMSTIRDRSIVMVPTKTREEQVKARQDPPDTASKQRGLPPSVIRSNDDADESVLDTYKSLLQESPTNSDGSVIKKRGFGWSSLRK
jgi:glutathione S-transferase